MVWHHSLPLMNSFNKTEAAVFSCRLCFLRAFPFISFTYERWKSYFFFYLYWFTWKYTLLSITCKMSIKLNYSKYNFKLSVYLTCKIWIILIYLEELYSFTWKDYSHLLERIILIYLDVNVSLCLSCRCHSLTRTQTRCWDGHSVSCMGVRMAWGGGNGFIW